MPRRRPLLESLEGRYAPAVASEVPAPVADTGRVTGSFDPTLALALAVSADASPEPFADGSPLDGGQVYFAPPALPDPLMSQIGRLPEQSLKFPASGGGGGEVHASDELAALLVPSAPAAPKEGEAEGEKEAAEEAPDVDAVWQAEGSRA